MTPTEIALQFAELHYHVFPLYKGRNGQRLPPFGWAGNRVDAKKADKAIPATDDVTLVAKWPDMVRHMYKSEVVGFGVVGRGVLILDLDVKGDKRGFAEFRQLAEQYKIPPTRMVTMSKSGGAHLFYKKPKKYQLAEIKTLSGVQVFDARYASIDLRGDGGYVVGPDEFLQDLTKAEKGRYTMSGLLPIDELPEFPERVMSRWTRTASVSDLEALTSLDDPEDFQTKVRRGEVPDFVPKGARNGSFFIFISALKNKGVPIDLARRMCAELAEKVEEPETLTASVNVEAMLTKAYERIESDPYSVANELLRLGLFQLTGHRGKLHYVILEDNPFISSRNVHDEAAMKTLLKSHEQAYENQKGKSTTLNPISVIIKAVTDANRADTLGFKPNAGEVFALSDETGSKRFLNTYRPLSVVCDPADLDEDLWTEFQVLVSRLFGVEGSFEYQLGMDFMAWLIQTPEVKPSIAPFLMSVNRGVGKSLLFNVMAAIMGTNKIGERQARMVKLDEISGRFFDPSGCLINMIDEVQFPVHQGMRKESTAFWRHLKNLVTAETVSVEIKGGATYQCPNSAAVALAGNFGSYFPIEEFDRRLWIIDANSPVLQMGTVDRLFDFVKRSALGADDRDRYVSTLRYKLRHHEIKTDLSSIRAPMTEVKQEMYENSLTDVEEWFVTHFRDTGNVFAYTPIVSQSAVLYAWEQSGRAGDRDAQTFFRDLKRKGHLRPIKLKRDSTSSRQFSVPLIGLDGGMTKTDKREVLYTTREHGEYDQAETNAVLDMFMQNCATIVRHKQQQMRRVKVSEEALLGR
jgi:hypothetical protein